MDNLLAGKLISPWEANLPRDVQHRSPYTPVENIPLKPITIPLAGDLLIAFSLESLIGLAPEWVIGFRPES